MNLETRNCWATEKPKRGQKKDRCKIYLLISEYYKWELIPKPDTLYAEEITHTTWLVSWIEGKKSGKENFEIHLDETFRANILYGTISLTRLKNRSFLRFGFWEVCVCVFVYKNNQGYKVNQELNAKIIQDIYLSPLCWHLWYK
jgi:hypothetical protein